MMSHPTEGILLHESTETLCHANHLTKVGITKWNNLLNCKTPDTSEEVGSSIIAGETTQEPKMTHNKESRF
jgi:hypothetical protein